jgi:hypothetical protein
MPPTSRNHCALVIDRSAYCLFGIIMEIFKKLITLYVCNYPLQRRNFGPVPPILFSITLGQERTLGGVGVEISLHAMLLFVPEHGLKALLGWILIPRQKIDVAIPPNRPPGITSNGVAGHLLKAVCRGEVVFDMAAARKGQNQ